MPAALDVPSPARARFAIVAVCTPGFPNSEDFEAWATRYADRHGYVLQLFRAKLRPHRPAAYSKLPALAAALATQADWLWWVDCDTTVLNPSVPLADVLRRALAAAGPPTPSMLLSYEVWGRTQAPRHGPGYYHPVNTGSFFLKNDEWAAGLEEELFS